MNILQQVLDRLDHAKENANGYGDAICTQLDELVKINGAGLEDGTEYVRASRLVEAGTEADRMFREEGIAYDLNGWATTATWVDTVEDAAVPLTGFIALYQDYATNASLIGVIPLAYVGSSPYLASGDFPDGLVVPGQSDVVPVLVGAPSNTVITLNVFARQYTPTAAYAYGRGVKRQVPDGSVLPDRTFGVPVATTTYDEGTLF